MKTTKIIPKSKQEWLALRKPFLNSTDIAALFGASPYVTMFELYYRHAEGLEADFTENDRMKWGTRLEPIIAAGVAEDNKWEIRKVDEYIFCKEHRCGSSYDFAVIDSLGNYEVDKAGLEIKNVDSLQFKEGWIVEDDYIEAPVHIEIQVQHQMLMSGLKKTYIVALVGGNSIFVIEREFDEEIGQQILKRIDDFWKRVDEKNPPPPDFPADAEFLAKLMKASTPGEVYTEENELLKSMVLQYKAAADEEKRQVETKKTLKAKMLEIIKDAEKAVGDGFSISAGTRGDTFIEAFTRQGYRDFRVFIKKEKTDA